MHVLHNIGVLATCPDNEDQADIGLIYNAALVWEEGRICFAGPAADLPAPAPEARHWDAGGRLVIPGLIDCHTHLAFGGWRGDEFEMRIAGRSYQEIAAAGGGIASTLQATRNASTQELQSRTAGFVAEMASLGVTTVEGKSGYGLSFEHELKQLEVYAALNQSQPVEVIATCLAGHIVPPEYREQPQAYVDLVCEEIIPAVAERSLARFFDVFVEQGAFDLEQAEQMMRTAQQHGLGLKVHADQLSEGGGAELAARLGAVSGEHLEYASDQGIDDLAGAGTIAVSLPIASTYLGNGFLDARRFIDHGVKVAVATDFNPGSAPSFHLPLALTLACTGQRMTPAEALKGATIYAARALNLQARAGSIEADKQADLAIIDAPSVNQWLYHHRANACVATFKAGQQIAGDALQQLPGGQQ